MAEANKEESDKCRRIAQAALASGDAEKAVRFLQKAKRMSPGDTSIDALLAEAAAASSGADAGAAGRAAAAPGDAGPRLRTSAATSSTGSSQGGKDGRNYTPEQSTLVRKILRTKDYYDILEVPRDSSEDAIKRAYKKLALKLHPDKNRAPGAEEAFKKVSKAVQCLTDEEKKQVYDRYGDEDRIPRQHQQHYQHDFMTPEDVFAAFFGGGTVHANFSRQQHRGTGQEGDASQAARMQLLQILPVLLLMMITLASNLSTRDHNSRFSFSKGVEYRNERTTSTLGVDYYVTDSFEELYYANGPRDIREFERQVEAHHVRNLYSDCDYQEKVMYKRVMTAKRRGNKEELQEARNHPRPACQRIETIKKKHYGIYRTALSMGMA